MKTLVLVPALNEAPRIRGLVARIRAVLPAAQVLVVDGGSEDETVEIGRRAGALVVPQQGPGYPGALSTGWRLAREQGFVRLVQLDADGQHPPEAAPRLLEALSGANLVVGSRQGTKSPGGLGRRLGNRLLAEVVRLAVPGRAAPADVTSGFQALDRRAIEVLSSCSLDRVADANLRVLALRMGLVLREVPVRMDERKGGRSMHDGLAGLRNLGRSLLAIHRASRVSL